MHVGRILAPAIATCALTLAGTAVAGAKEHQGSVNVEKVRRDAHGRAIGAILEGGTELVGDVDSRELMRVVAVPGDPVRVTADAEDRLVLVNGRTLETAVIGARDRAVVRPLINNPLGIGGGPIATDSRAARFDDASQLERFTTVARVVYVLESRVGAPSGLLLDDGTQVQVVPRFSGALQNIKPGMLLRVEGVGTLTAGDASMWALSISRDEYVYLDVERGEGAPEINVTGPFED